MGLLRRTDRDEAVKPAAPAPEPSPSDRITVAWSACPKCKSSDVVLADQGVGYDVWIDVRMGSGRERTNEFASWLCLDCGFAETYLTDRARLDRIRANPEQSGWRRRPSDPQP